MRLTWSLRCGLLHLVLGLLWLAVISPPRTSTLPVAFAQPRGARAAGEWGRRRIDPGFETNLQSWHRRPRDGSLTRGHRAPPLPKRRADHAFAIICQGRSGSTYLTHMLNAHPAMTVYGEVMHEPNYEFKATSGSCYYGVFGVQRDNSSMVREYLDMFFDDRLCEYGFCGGKCDRERTKFVRPAAMGNVSPPCGASCVAKHPGEHRGLVGVKLLIGMQLIPAMPAVTSYEGFRVLFLIRRDILMRTLSNMHRLISEDARMQGLRRREVHAVPLSATAEDVIRYVKRDLNLERGHHDRVKSLGAEFHIVWYEDLVAAQRENRWDSGPWRRLTDFLGVQPHALSPSSDERHPKTTLEAVQEFYPQIAEYRREVRAAFPEYSDRLGCELDHLFPDDPCHPPSAAAPTAPS